VRAPVWIVVPILAAGCAGGSAHHAAKRAPKQQPHAAKTTPASRVPHRAVRAQAPAKPLKKQARHRARRLLPWQPAGISTVAYVRVKRVAVYTRPHAKRALLVLKKHDRNGTRRTFLVRGVRGDWVHVYLPTRPNGSLGWVRSRAVKLYSDGYRLVVRLRAHRLQLWRARKRLATYPVAIGTAATPTPRGLYYIVELLQPDNPGGSYGPYSFGLSAHSNVLKTFAGGDGRVGLHGTNEPGLIGSSVSHGCIRLRNAAILRLAKMLPLGTPVYIRS
jgi:lipoprotein-anchoring transpeptidase ErfK/SrfK